MKIWVMLSIMIFLLTEMNKISISAYLLLGHSFILIDSNPQAMQVMAKRFAGCEDIEWIGYDPA